MDINLRNLIIKNISVIIEELSLQNEVGETFHKEYMSFEDNISFLKELTFIGGEYGLAYENIVNILEEYSFFLSSKSAIKLLELGLIFKFKTEKKIDLIFKYN